MPMLVCLLILLSRLSMMWHVTQAQKVHYAENIWEYHIPSGFCWVELGRFNTMSQYSDQREDSLFLRLYDCLLVSSLCPSLHLDYSTLPHLALTELKHSTSTELKHLITPQPLSQHNYIYLYYLSKWWIWTVLVRVVILQHKNNFIVSCLA